MSYEDGIHYDFTKSCWYSVYTKSRYEMVVCKHLDGKGIQSFLPLIKVPSRRRDRKKIIEVPLFRSYIFFRTCLDVEAHLEVLKTPGVVFVVGNSRGPVQISDTAIESLRIISGSDKVVTGDKLLMGDHVIVVSGPFEGVYGVFARYSGANRVVINIEALGQFAAVEISAKDVEPVSLAALKQGTGSA